MENPNSANTAKSDNPETGRKTQKVKWYRKKIFIIPFFVFLLIIAAGFWYWDTYLRGYVSTDDAHIEGNSVAISAKILGRITNLTVNEGDTVSMNQFLVQLDSTDLHARKVQARANVEYAKQSAALAQVNQKLAQEDFNRAAVQFQKKIIPQEQYDHAKQALDRAKVQHDMALAQISTAKAQLDVIKTQLLDTRIYSPISGVVARRWVLPGDVVQPAQPIFTIYNLSDIWITANFEEGKINSIHMNDPVEISVDAYPGINFSGSVFEVGAAAASQFSLIPPNNASGNYTKVSQRVPFKISIHQDDKHEDIVHLLPGMSVVVKVRVKGESK
ncbi:MAG: HlyD family secretion protein [Calditrichia bacterium]